MGTYDVTQEAINVYIDDIFLLLPIHRQKED